MQSRVTNNKLSHISNFYCDKLRGRGYNMPVSNKEEISANTEIRSMGVCSFIFDVDHTIERNRIIMGDY